MAILPSAQADLNTNAELFAEEFLPLVAGGNRCALAPDRSRGFIVRR
jgi:hypothetical protein